MPRHPFRLLVHLLLLAVVASSCGFGLNTGNAQERADWDRFDREQAALKEAEQQRAALLGALRNGQVPGTTTTTTTTQPSDVDEQFEAPVATTTTTILDGATAPGWCFDLVEFTQLGTSFMESTSPALRGPTIDRLVSLLSTIATQAGGEEAAQASQLRDALQSLADSVPQDATRAEIAQVLDAFLDERRSLIGSFVVTAGETCLGREVQLDLP